MSRANRYVPPSCRTFLLGRQSYSGTTAYLYSRHRMMPGVAIARQSIRARSCRFIYDSRESAIATGKDACRKIEVLEYLVSSFDGSSTTALREGGKIHMIEERDTDAKNLSTWTIIRSEGNQCENSIPWNVIKAFPQKTISLLLPAQYPMSVASGYSGFVSYSFIASIAGSAAMVLSTQTLLFAVGIVGQNSTSSIMAGALNWVMKDFAGQLGGILFASQMTKTKAFDTDPKRWRMVAAMATDVASMIEIASPLCHQSLILPLASIANVAKNIGFLTASASRAALHQSLAITGNLGDVTVKAGSQSMIASLVGTSFGIVLSWYLQHDMFHFGISFTCLSLAHQGCTYLSLKYVPLTHFNRHRLHFVLEEYLHTKRMLTPGDLAGRERFYPLSTADSSLEWLKIGRSLAEIYRDKGKLEKQTHLSFEDSYLIHLDDETHEIDLIYFKDANEQDLIRGIYHAYVVHHVEKTPKLNLDRTNGECIVQKSKVQLDHDFLRFFQELGEQGWKTSSGTTTIEDSDSRRISIQM